MSIPSIDEMPFLRERLGKVRSDRLRYAGKENTEKLRASTNILNTVLHEMQKYQPTDYCDINDVLTGAARMDGTRDKPLSVGRLYNVFQCIEMINTREVIAMMAVEVRQAQRYVRAARFALPRIKTILDSKKQK